MNKLLILIGGIDTKRIVPNLPEKTRFGYIFGRLQINGSEIFDYGLQQGNSFGKIKAIQFFYPSSLVYRNIYVATVHKVIR